MKEMSRFLGISCFICTDFNAPPHFHVQYNQHSAVIDMENTAIVSGSIPPRVAALATEWTMLNKELLKASWDKSKAGSTDPVVVPPLVD